MKFIIDKNVFEKFPNLVVAIPIILGFDNKKSEDEALRFLRNAEVELNNKYTLDRFNLLENVISYEKCFTEFGTDPKVFLPAHVALSRRILEGGNIPNINPLVNLYNGFSIANTIPFGGEDLDKVYGDFHLFVAKGGEKWMPIGSKKSQDAIAGEIVWGDEKDLSTRALNWRQCDRTKLTGESKNGYFVMDGFRGVDDALIKETAELFVKKVEELFGGKSQILWLDKENPGAEIDFESKKIEEVEAGRTHRSAHTNQKKYNFLAKKIFEVAQSPVEHPSVEKFGDYAVRGDIDFYKLDMVEKVDKVAGFSNIWIKESVLVDEAKKIANEDFKIDLEKIGVGKTMVIDYSAPNIAKPFGIGHLRSTNIGQAIYNIYKYLGWKCIGDNHLGDWGTQFGKMITAIKHWGMEESIEGLEKLYVKFHSEAEKDETLNDEARAWFAKLESGDEEAREIWQKCVEISLKEFNRVYETLGVKIDFAYGESFYEKMLPGIVDLFKNKGLVESSRGATVVKLTENPEAILLKSDGATNYLTRDLATIKFRFETWQPDLIVYEVGSEQSLYFRQLFEAARLAGWDTSYVHIGHGLIRWKEGKFSTRKGDTIHLAEVIETAMEQAKKIAPENNDEAIKKVAVGAIKFNDLSSDPKRDVIFDWDRVMSMEGSSGPYLQYTYARCASVLKKSTKSQILNPKMDEKFDENEMQLLRYFYIFLEKVVEAAERMSPAVVAEFLLNLARKYNEFYAKCRIIGEPEEARRIFLTEVTAKIIREGLGLLGIETLEKM